MTEHEHEYRHEQKGKGPERFIDATQKLIDACLADTEVVYVHPLDEELEPVTDIPNVDLGYN